MFLKGKLFKVDIGILIYTQWFLGNPADNGRKHCRITENAGLQEISNNDEVKRQMRMFYYTHIFI